ncbi:MAG: hypothetical protein WCY75_06680 [Sulfurimonadaceae bacterium]|jgi:uncharacterized membrane protein
MGKFPKQQRNNTTKAKGIEENSNSSATGVNATFNQQNNYHLAQTIDIEKLSILSEKNPEIANRIMCFYEEQQKHNINIDKNILELEQKEQNSRLSEKPYQRKFAFKALYFAITLSVLSLFAAAYFAYLGHVILAGTSITIPMGVVVANLLGFKGIGQQSKSDKKDKQEEE